MKNQLLTLIVLTLSFCCLSGTLVYGQDEMTDKPPRGPVNTPHPDLVIPKSASSAISVDASSTDSNDPLHPTNLVEDLLISGCLQADNISFSGNRLQIGRFERNTDNPNFPLESGIILSTGDVRDAVGPNEQENTTTAFSARGDSDLASLAGVGYWSIYDPAILTFDFIPDGDVVEFRYIFASEEYPEWACSEFNDVFGFFISGPGISGTYSNDAENVALLPDGSPVAINNIHVGGWDDNNPGESCPDVNAEYYVEVPPGEATIEYDGRTVVLTAKIENLQPCETYQIKIAIADVNDRQWDSAVFLEAKSFTSTGNINIKNFYDGQEKYDVFQGCGDNEIRFYRDEDSDINEEIIMDYEIAGSAIAGTHYTGLTSGNVTIPAGEEFVALDYDLPLVDVSGTKTIVARVNAACPCDDDEQWIERTIRIHDPFEVKSFSTEPQSSCIENDGSLTILAGSGASSYDYNFTYELYNSAGDLVETQSTGANIELTFEDLGSDSYTIKITEASSCHVIVTDEIVIEGPDSPDLDISSNSPVCEDQTIELSASSETSGLTYDWSGPDDFSSDEANPEITNASAANAGSYSLTVTAPNHCTTTRGLDVVVNELPEVEITTSESLEFCDGESITLTASDGESYLWSTDETTQSITVDSGGEFSVEVTDENGCKAEASVETVVNPLPTIEEIADFTVCEGEEITLEAVYSNGDLSWDNEVEDGEPFEITETTTFTATVGNDCDIVSESVTVTVNPLPTIEEIADFTVCEGAEITLEAVYSNGNLSWDNEVEDGEPFVITETTTFTATVGNDCDEVSESVTVTVNPLPIVTCPDDITIGVMAAPITLEGAEPLNGTYAGPGVVDGIFDPEVAGVGSHIITYTYQDENSCESYCQFTIDVISMPDFACIPDMEVCHDEPAFELEQPEYEGGVYTGAGVTDGVFDPASVEPGEYQITYILVDEYGHEYSCNFFIVVNPVPDVTLQAFEDVCDNTVITLEGGMPEGGTYYINGAEATEFDAQELGLGEHEITYVYENEFECVSEATQTIEVLQSPCFEITATDISCFGYEDGSIFVDIDSDCGSVVDICLEYADDDMQKCDTDKFLGYAEFENLVAGTYYVYVTGSNGCVTVEEVVIGEPEELIATAEAEEQTICHDGETTITVTAQGGTEPYEGVGEFTVGVGTHEFIVTDANDCVSVVEITIEAHPVTEVVCREDILIGEFAHTITLEGSTPEGGVYEGPGVSFDEDAGQYLFSASDAGVGVHTITYLYEDEYECLYACEFEIEVYEMPDFTCLPDIMVCNDDEVVELEDSAFPNGEFTGEGVADNSFDPMAVNPGEYTITYTYTDEFGYEYSCTFIIVVNPVPVVTLEAFEPVCDNTVMALEGGLPEGGQYYIDGVASDEFDAEALGTGMYEITYIYENEFECVSEATQTIEVLQSPCFEITATDISCYGYEDGSIFVDIDSECGDVVDICLEYADDDKQKCDTDKFLGYAEVENLVAGTYYVVVTGANGCVTVEEVVIGEPEELVVVAEVEHAECYGETGSATLEITGGTEPYSVDWEGADPDALYAGTYTVFVTDANDCFAETTITIEQPAEMVVDIVATDATCAENNDGEISLTIEGNTIRYMISVTGDSFDEYVEIDNVNGPVTWSTGSVLEPGSYTIVITDEEGCSFSDELYVGAPEPLVATAHVEQPLCDDDNGSVSIEVVGGTEPYEVHWNDLDPDNLTEGNYNIWVTDAHDCETSVSFEIVNPEPLQMTADITHLEEYGDGSGAISLNVTGGTPPYEYMWDNGEITSTIDNLQAGTYFVTVIDANGCIISDEFEVTHPSILVDLGVTIEVDIQTPDPEEVDELIFAVVVTNHDEKEDATGVVVENILPDAFPYILRLDDGTSGNYDPLTGEWEIGTLAAGEHVILVYKTEMLLTEEEKSNQMAVNAAEILPFDQIDPDLSNNYDEIVVTVGESTGGDDNGIESNGSMASQLALRNHRRLVESNHIARAERTEIMAGFSHMDILTGSLKTATVDGQHATDISMLLPEEGPAQTKAYVSTPADLLGITNAREIFSVDYLQENNARRAAILAISTEPSTVYEHTKVICDRLVGAELRNIEMIEIAGKPFILSKLVHPGGYVDYAVSFIAQRNGSEFVVDNRWYNEEYKLQNSDDVFNFQVWSVTPQFTAELVEEILEMMEDNGGVAFRNDELTPAIPQVFVHSGRYANGGLELNIVNKAGADQITIYGSKTTVENGAREPMELTVDIPTDTYSEVFVPTGFIFDAGFSITNNKDNAPDVLYYADGAWMFDYDPGNATVTNFTTVAETMEPNTKDHKVERDASFQGRVRTWASMFRALSPRNMPVDLNGYDEVVFTASGEGRVEVMLAKESIHQWNEQFRTTITLTEEEREYRISFNDLVTRQGEKGFSPEDVVSVVFNPLGNGNTISDFDVNIRELRFSSSLFVEKPNATFYPAYPNPFRNQTSMNIIVNRDNPVKVEVMNVFGQHVETLVNEEMTTGTYQVRWEPTGQKPGVYIIRTTVGNDTYTSKVILQK